MAARLSAVAETRHESVQMPEAAAAFKFNIMRDTTECSLLS
jgi:hypothetical protein